MAMVRRGVMLSFREASCCRVEVVKGGEGLRCLSVRLTVLDGEGGVLRLADHRVHLLPGT